MAFWIGTGTEQSIGSRSNKTTTIDALAAEWMLPPGAAKDKAILYFHGGGLVVGSIRAHRGIAAKFVKGSGIPALGIDYGLAPEHPSSI